MGFKLSTKGIYGLMTVIDLSSFYGSRLVTVKEVAKRQNISEKYLEQIINKLNKSGLLESIRGAYGGYKLAKDPRDITIGMVLRVLEGDLSPTDCASKGCSHNKQDVCETFFVWKKIKEAVDGVVDNITIYEILKKYDVDEKYSV